jgi:hypothetical protein
MSGDHHRGIRYSITEPIPGRWNGRFIRRCASRVCSPRVANWRGSWVEAVAIAKRHIDSQDMHNANTRKAVPSRSDDDLDQVWFD